MSVMDRSSSKRASLIHAKEKASSKVVGFDHKSACGENATVDQIKKRSKWENDDYVCRGLILNGMSDPLFDIYQNVESSQELCDSLEAKYMVEDASSKNSFILARFTQHKMKMDEAIQDSDKPKGNNVVSPSIVNMVEHNNSFRYNDNKGKRKHQDTKVDPNKKSKVTCWKCGKPRHLKKDCKGGKVDNKANGSSTNGSVNGFFNLLKGQNMFNKSFQIYYVIYVYEAYFVQDDDVAWVWGCRAVVRLPDPKLKTLDERGIECIFVRYVKHSKAFRLSSVPGPSQMFLINETEDIGGSVAPKEVVIQQPEPKLRKNKRNRTSKNFGPEFQLYLTKGTRDEVSNQHSYCFNVEDDPKIFDEAMKSQDVAFWKEAINDEMDSILGNNTWVLVDLPPGCKWILKRKLKVNGTIKKFKARLFIHGFRQKLRIYYFDTYVSVARISTIRLLIALTSIHNLIIHQMDVKTSFLNSELEEEVYMNQPQGFIMHGNENNMCKLIKSVYRLKQAPKQWHQKFDKVVLSSGRLLNQADKCVYRKLDKFGKGVIICLYVDDMLIFGTNQVQVDLTKELLSSKFSIKDIGEADVILVSTPMDTNEKLIPNNDQAVSQLKCFRVIGCQMYAMTCTRPDIAFVVGKLILEGYTDASWISNTKDNSSTSGRVFLLGGGAISWASKKQTCITNSTMESKFVALAAAGKEAECDATLAKAYSQMYNGKSRHLGVKHNMIHGLIMNGVVSIEFVRPQQNLADYLTKKLARDLVIKSAEGICLKLYGDLIPFDTVFRLGPVWGCDRLVIRAKIIENQIMAASAIVISSDSSNKSVGSPPSRVILFSDIPTVIPSTYVVAPETSTIAPVISSAAPVVETTLVASPTGLCGLVPYSGSDSDSPDEMSSPEHISLLPAISSFLCTDSSEAPDSSNGPPSQDMYVMAVARSMSKVASCPSSSSEFPIAPVTASPRIRRRLAILIRPGEAIPFGRPYSTHLNGPRKLLTARKRVGPLPALKLACRRVSPRSLDHRSSSSRSSSDSSPVHSSGLDAPDQAYSGSSARDVPPRLCYPPGKAPRCKSSSRDSSKRPMHSSSHYAGPSRKRCRSPVDSVPSSTLVMGSLAPTRADLLPPRKRFKDSYSSEASIEEDTEVDPIETEVDMELGIGDGDDVRDHAEIDPRDVRDDTEEYEADTNAGDTVEVGIDPMSTPIVEEEIIDPAGEDSSYSSGTRDGIDCRDETVQRRLEADQSIARGQRVSMIERIDSLRLDDLKEEFWQVRRDRDNTRERLRRTMTITRSGMTSSAIEEIINQRVDTALETRRVNRDLELGNGNDNGGGNGNGNGNGNGTRNGNNRGDNGDGNENRNVNGRGDRPGAYECTYQDFMKCQPLSFKGTKDVVGLIRWSEKMETVFHISNYLERYQVKYATCTLLDSALTWWNSYKRTIGTDAAYALSWRELLKLMTEVYCPRNEPTRLQDAIQITNHLMDKKLKGYANTRGQNVARAYTAGNNEKNGYGGTLSFCNRCKLHHEGQCTAKCQNCKRIGHLARDCRFVVTVTTQGTPWPNQGVVTCFECGVQGHYRKDCPKVKNQNHGNKSRVPDTRGKSYVVGGGDANPGSNTITGTFLLNDHHAYMLFDSGADRSFVSNTFSTLLDIIPSALDVSYAVELADGRTSKSSTMLRGYTLGLLGHPFNIDLMPIDLDSFDVIIGMDWLAKNHVVIVCDKKIVRIPYGNEILIIQGDKSDKEKKSTLSIISCVKAQKYMEKGCQLFLAQVTVKENKNESKEKRLDDVPTVRDFPEVFPKDLPGLPPVRQVEFQINLVLGAAPVARAPYRLARSEMEELSTQLQELSDKGFIRPSSSP
ncbi:putative reverse transcriptase domain-containing protein [Tanacetum coccineum]|uniref:Reverse transcriptase domain-containing protein n=1 Tax=Tanacetum coccineum TaxID=301880 RepID=A0ABQ5EMT0_9ASTR